MGINEGNKTRSSKVRGLSSGNVAEEMKMIRVNVDGVNLCFWAYIENVGYTHSTDLF